MSREFSKEQLELFIRERHDSPLVNFMKVHGHELAVPPYTFHLAKDFGFCYGVSRAVRTAYEIRLRFPDRRIFITNEIIHNPQINRELEEMGIRFLKGSDKERFRELSATDIVILPAFGVSLEEKGVLEKINCLLVDTTCGSVVSVWRRVEQYAKDGFTSLIHGKFNHEETQATCSRVLPGRGHFLVVKDLKETEWVADFIEGKSDLKKFLEQFRHAVSPSFDPERDLIKIGCANQTTMLSSESLEIAGRIRLAMERRYGRDALDQHFRSFDTVCSATQNRQDAIRELLRERPLDLMLVVGGFNSSNTGHLAAIASEKVKTYHISEARDILSLQEIRCQPAGDKNPKVIGPWLPEKFRIIGLTAGASTPDRVIEDVLKRFLHLHGLSAGERG
jgi:4-hydroxy-3-methylbut-2-enyl diphosphate reductase